MTIKNYFLSNKTLRFFPVVALIVLTSCSPVKEYLELQEVTKWEPDIAKFEALDKTEKYPDDAILFAGSSSIRLWSTLAADMAPYSVIQRGYGGARFSDYAVYADRIFSPHKCSALVLFIANDITGGAGDKRPEEVKALFRYIHHNFRKYNPGAPVFFIEITPTWLRWKAWLQIEECNETIKKWCENHSRTYFIETEKAFLSPDGKPRQEYFRSDSLHLNSEGYKVWNKIIKEELEAVLGDRD
jgi:hypothetical protein